LKRCVAVATRKKRNFDKMVDKVLRDPLTPILNAMRWDFDEAVADSTQVTVDDFM
jgi:hypothetical protein